jgi:ubiquinone/menaquinone biosynthesis C-methylase UbiE
VETRPNADGWLEDTRASYDAVADSYADLTRDLLDDTPEERAVLALLADMVGAQGGGIVADVGCGAGRITAHLRHLGVDAFGIDLSPGMIEAARRDHPGVRFELGSMTDLALADASMTGLVAWYSLIHVPDDEIRTVLAHFRGSTTPASPSTHTALLHQPRASWEESFWRDAWRDARLPTRPDESSPN